MNMQNMHSETAAQAKAESPLDCLIDHLTGEPTASSDCKPAQVSRLLAAASSASSAATDLIEAARDETIASPIRSRTAPRWRCSSMPSGW